MEQMTIGGDGSSKASLAASRALKAVLQRDTSAIGSALAPKSEPNSTARGKPAQSVSISSTYWASILEAL